MRDVELARVLVIRDSVDDAATLNVNASALQKECALAIRYQKPWPAFTLHRRPIERNDLAGSAAPPARPAQRSRRCRRAAVDRRPSL